MKNYLIAVIILAAIIGGLLFIKNTNKNQSFNASQTANQITTTIIPSNKSGENNFYKNFFQGEIKVCQLFPKEKIEELSGKPVVNTESVFHKESNFNQYLCSYYQGEAKYSEVAKGVNIAKHIAVSVVEGRIQIKRTEEGYRMLKYTSKQDKDIPFNHLLIYDEKGKFHHLDLLLSDDYKISVETWWSLLSNEEALQFVKKFALYFKDLVENSQSSLSTKKPTSPTAKTTTSYNQSVPLPQDEDIIRNFVSQIEDGKADEAAKMMKISDQSPSQANSELQAWAVQFSNITSFKLLKMEKANESEWTDKKHIYKVVLDVWMDPPRSADAPIPYYGWNNGENIRWITLEKINNNWKIATIATGP